MDYKLNTLLGAAEYTAIKRDGPSEPIKIKQLPVRSLPAYRMALNNEVELVKLVTGKDDAFIDSLSNESFERIVEIGEELNRDFFGRWLARQKKREDVLPKSSPAETLELLSVMEKTSPDLFKKIVESAGLTSPTTSPNSPSKSA